MAPSPLRHSTCHHPCYGDIERWSTNWLKQAKKANTSIDPRAKRSVGGMVDYTVMGCTYDQFQPLSSFKILLTKPEITLTFVWTSLLYTEFYCILYVDAHSFGKLLTPRTVFSTILEDKYNLTELQIGLCYLCVFPAIWSERADTFRPSGFGAIIGSYFNGLAQDYYYRKEMKRAGGDHRKASETFKLEWTRLRCLFPFATSVPLLRLPQAVAWN